jgi:hypothetical protein
MNFNNITVYYVNNNNNDDGVSAASTKEHTIDSKGSPGSHLKIGKYIISYSSLNWNNCFVIDTGIGIMISD